MKTRPFGSTGFAASEMGLGCWQLGGSDWGDLDDSAALAILRAAGESGVNFFDTADVYGDGRSEELVGRHLKERSEPSFVATKLGRTADLYPDNYTAAGLRRATEASLRRLGVERLDLTQLHCVPSEVLERGEVFGILADLQEEGLIRHYGASVESMDEAFLCLKDPGIASLQIIFNLFRQKPILTVFPEAAARNIAIIVRLPLASGVLSGRMTAETQFPANDHRHYNRDGAKFNVGETFAGLPMAKAVELADRLRPLVPEGLTLADLAQRWILDHPAVSTVITGASRPGQVRANAAVAEMEPLAPDLALALGEFYVDHVRHHIRGPY